MTTTVDTATDADIWPDGYMPPAELRSEIRKVARTISDEEVRDTGWTFEPWYSKFVIAEHRVKKRKALAEEYRKTQRVQKSERATAAKVAVKYPDASAWAERPAYQPAGTGDEDFERFRKDWFERVASKKMPVFRPTVSASAGATINDLRKLWRDTLVALHESDCVSTFIWRERVDELEKRIEELEARAQIDYRGNFEEERGYAPGQVVSYGGSAWICDGYTMERPSTHSKSWKLFVSSGRDGKSATKG